MTKLLDKALDEIQRLPEEEQDFYAQVLLDTLTSERKWNELFARPIEGTKLEQLIQEAEEDIRAGRTESMEDFLKGEDHHHATEDEERIL